MHKSQIVRSGATGLQKALKRLYGAERDFCELMENRRYLRISGGRPFVENYVNCGHSLVLKVLIFVDGFPIRPCGPRAYDGNHVEIAFIVFNCDVANTNVKDRDKKLVFVDDVKPMSRPEGGIPSVSSSAICILALRTFTRALRNFTEVSISRGLYLMSRDTYLPGRSLELVAAPRQRETDACRVE